MYPRENEKKHENHTKLFRIWLNIDLKRFYRFALSGNILRKHMAHFVIQIIVSENRWQKIKINADYLTSSRSFFISIKRCIFGLLYKRGLTSPFYLNSGFSISKCHWPFIVTRGVAIARLRFLEGMHIIAVLIGMFR